MQYIIKAHNNQRFQNHKITVKPAFRKENDQKQHQNLHQDEETHRNSNYRRPTVSGTTNNKSNKNNNKFEPEIIQQPSFRTIHATTNKENMQEIERSLIGFTKQAEWADVLQERLLNHSIYGVQVRGISHRKFLLTFLDTEEMGSSSREELLDHFSSIREVRLLDLIIPRVAWVWCDGLPIVA